MKILLLAPQPFYTLRGTPIAVRAVIEVLADEGHDLDVLTYFQGEDLNLENVRIHRIRRPPLVHSVPIGPSWQKIPCDGAMLAAAYRLLRENRYDVMHGVEDGAVLAAALSRLTGVPYVFDMDSHMSAQIVEKSALLWPVSKLFSVAERWALRNALGVLAACPALETMAAKHQPSENVSLLPDMPMNEGVQPEPDEEIVKIGGMRIVYVGNLEPYQGIDLLLEAFRAVASSHPEARLVIVGGSSEAIARYTASAPALVESGRARFLGPRPLERLGSILAASHILASPRLEGVNTPMKIYSYLESGRPLLATRLHTHTQVLPEEAACLVEPHAEAMATGLSKLLSDPSLRDRLGRRGRELVRTEYGRDRFRRRLTAFYDRVAVRVAS